MNKFLTATYYEPGGVLTHNGLTKALETQLDFVGLSFSQTVRVQSSLLPPSATGRVWETRTESQLNTVFCREKTRPTDLAPGKFREQEDLGVSTTTCSSVATEALHPDFGKNSPLKFSGERSYSSISFLVPGHRALEERGEAARDQAPATQSFSRIITRLPPEVAAGFFLNPRPRIRLLMF